MIEDNRKRYEGTGLEALMKASGHEICPRCYCCDLVSESATCWQCNGMEPEPDDWEDDGYCSECDGEGKVYWKACIGRCDEQGNHKQELSRVGDPLRSTHGE